MIHTVKGFGVVNKAEVDVFLEFSCFFYDQMDVCNLISGSSAFLKSILNIWKFMVNILLKPGLGNFYLLACEQSADVWWFEHSMTLPFFGDWNENWPFSSPVDTAELFLFAGILSAAL